MPIPVDLPHSSPWQIQARVIYGLFIRECATRVGKTKLGLFWTLLEPLATVVFLGVVLGFIMERTVPEIPYPLFILAGILPFNLFKGIIRSSITCLKANQGLLVHQKVKPTDPIFARVLYQAVVSGLAFLLFVIVATFFFESTPDFSSPLTLILAALAVVLMATGAGIVLAVLAWRYQELERAVPLVLQPLFYVSCVIYPLHIVPAAYRKFFLANPLVHVIELMRQSLFPHYRTGDVGLAFPLLTGLALFWLGMAYYRANRGILYDFGR